MKEKLKNEEIYKELKKRFFKTRPTGHFFKSSSLSVNAQVEKNEFFAGIAYQPSFTFKVATPTVNFAYMLKSIFKVKNDQAITVSVCSAPRMDPVTFRIPPYISNYNTTSILTGYQKCIKKIYIEPQIGIGIFSKEYYDDYEGIGPDGRVNDGAVFYGIESGYRIGKRFKAFVKYHWLNSFTTFSHNVLGISNDRSLRYGGVGISFKLD